MPGIVVAQNFKNNALQAGESLASALIADSGVKNWFQADANSVTLSGNDIASFNDRKGTASKLTRADAANGATLVSNAFGPYSGARFNAVESDRSLFNGDALDLTQPFSWS
ncbi:TPA: hypothetical protein ACHJHX_005144, partial [Klebsiella pneumoniae]